MKERTDEGTASRAHGSGMKGAGIVLLALGALSFGGCTIFFFPFLLEYGADPGIVAWQLSGLVATALCIFGIVALVKSGTDKDGDGEGR